MLNRDLAIRRDLEFESFLKKLGVEGRTSDIERLYTHGRKKLLESSPRVIKEIFPEIWEEFKTHSRLVEKTRRGILEPILPENFDIQELENSIASQIEKIEGKGFAFRSHQADGLEKIGDFFDQPGRRSGYIKLPTGMGKTILFSALIRTFCSKNPDTRVLILSPKDIVNQQNLRAIDRLQTEETKTGITQAGKVENTDGEVLDFHPNALVSTYQLLAVSERDDPRFGKADVIILDELHRSFGAKTVEELKGRYPNAIFLGLSATPYLGDPQSKNPKRAENYIGECIMSIALPEAIESGALAPVRGFLVHTQGEEIDKLLQSGEDVSDSMYEEKIDKTQRTKITMEILKKYINPNSNRLSRRAMVYCAGIQHTEETFEALKKSGFVVARVHSKMDKGEIDEAIEGYKSGKYDVICNSDMLIEGFDDAKTSLLINIRPTRSLTTFEQMIGRAIRLDEENPGKIADIYNITGVHSEEYTIYGLAKYYRKLQTDSMNGSLVFPTKLSDVERKVQSYEKTNILPTWTDEERVLLKQYFPEWYSFFFATKGVNDKRPGKGIVIQFSEDSTFVMPDIIQTESVEKIFFPMDFEYFENMENLKQDYESWIAACGDKPGTITDAYKVFETVSGETLKMSQYLGRLMKNTQELEDFTPMQCLFWLQEKLNIEIDSSNLNLKRIMNRSYVENNKKLESDYNSFLSILNDSSDKRPNYIAPHNRKFSFNDNMDHTITLEDYLRTLKWATNMREATHEEMFQWWTGKIGKKLQNLDKPYFSDEINLKTDFEYAYGKLKLCFETEADIAKVVKYGSKIIISKGGVYTNTDAYLTALLNTIPELAGLSKKDALIWWMEHMGYVVIRTSDFSDPEKLKKLNEEGGITDDFLTKLRRNIPGTYQKSNTELIGELQKLTRETWILQTEYFSDIENLRHDFNTIKILLGGKDITMNDINNDIEFQTKVGLKISIKKYIDELHILSKGVRADTIRWWKDKIGIVDNQINVQKVALNAQYFLCTENIGKDHLSANPIGNDGRYLFASQSGNSISINTYLAWIESSIPEMRGKSKEVRMDWWKQQSELEKSGRSMNVGYFTQEHLQKDYESLKVANNGKPPTASKSALGLMFACENGEGASAGITLETYLGRLKIYIEVLKNSNDADVLKWWKEQIKTKK